MSDHRASHAAEGDRAQSGAVETSHRPAGMSRRAVALFVMVAAVVLVADLGLKYLSFTHVAGRPVEDVSKAAEDPRFWVDRYPHEPVEVVPGVLSLRLTTNTGAVFGLGAGNQWLFILVSIVACGLIVFIFARSRPEAWLMHVGLALILAGALGNLYDRMRYAAVRDMLWLLPETGLWPWIFNLADAALMVGVFTVIALTWWRELRQQGAETAAD